MTPSLMPSISLIEFIYLVEKGRPPGLALARFREALASPNSSIKVAPLDSDVALAVQAIPATLVPDMPDRIIAATALHLDALLVTRDRRIRAAGMKTIW